MTSLLFALSLSVSCSAAAPRELTTDHELTTDIDYAKLFAAGVPFSEFLSNAKERKELWHSNYGKAAVPDAVMARATRVTGTWNVLVVAVDSCSDSVSTIPYIAKLVESMPNVTLRIVDPKAGKEAMETYRTPDNRAATPTVILLDASFTPRGCWIERPRELREWISGETTANGDVFSGKMNWYEKDAGVSTITEFVEMIEKASRGEPACEAKSGSSRQ